MNIIINTETGQRQIICDADLFLTLLSSRIAHAQQCGVDPGLYEEMKKNVMDALNAVKS